MLELVVLLRLLGLQQPWPGRHNGHSADGGREEDGEDGDDEDLGGQLQPLFQLSGLLTRGISLSEKEKMRCDSNRVVDTNSFWSAPTTADKKTAGLLRDAGGFKSKNLHNYNCYLPVRTMVQLRRFLPFLDSKQNFFCSSHSPQVTEHRSSNKIMNIIRDGWGILGKIMYWSRVVGASRCAYGRKYRFYFVNYLTVIQFKNEKLDFLRPAPATKNSL